MCNLQMQLEPRDKNFFGNKNLIPEVQSKIFDSEWVFFVS